MRPGHLRRRSGRSEEEEEEEEGEGEEEEGFLASTLKKEKRPLTEVG